MHACAKVGGQEPEVALSSISPAVPVAAAAVGYSSLTYPIAGFVYEPCRVEQKCRLNPPFPSR